MVIRNERTISPNDFDLYLNDTHFDISFLKSLPKKAEKSNLKVNNGETKIVSLSSTHQQPLSPPPPPQLTQREIQEQQLSNILSALIGEGDFTGWANLLSSADLSSLPLTATFFILGNDTMSNLHNSLDPFLIAYHIIPQRLSFSDLQQFKPITRIPTLLPSKYIVETNNSVSNYTIDGSHITYPDVYVNSDFTVYGVDIVLEYSVYDLQQFKPNTYIPTLLPSKYVVVTNNFVSNYTIDGSHITYPDVYVNSDFTVYGVDIVLEYSVYSVDPLFSPPDLSPPMNYNVPVNNGETKIVSLSSTHQQPLSPPPPPQLTHREIQEQQLSNILSALIGEGDFTEYLKTFHGLWK
ncbi:hypothetical protein RND71_009865 [Anisodus tanguticus]|uniref:FAS1 domain-containing protein n=1 Tax=Anisodus tanguticus TaxID=243964 RepID=A0AAE1VS82_9SOLA|nr:hypothetical protein RND71_009865 [Anisodus tanguticus]